MSTHNMFLWRIDKNNSSIIIKFSPCLFYCLNPPEHTKMYHKTVKKDKNGPFDFAVSFRT